MKLSLPLPIRIQSWLTIALLGLTAGWFLAPLVHAAEKQLYTCGMHPQIIRNTPGDCPICGMKLQPVRANAPAYASAGERKIRYYQSTMMPGEVSGKPGKDSMGMEMEPVYEAGANAAISIQIDAATIQRMNLKTDVAIRGPVRREIRTVGTIAFNEQGIREITTKYEGWIDKLYVDATWASVKAGDPLFEIYSPDLYNAQLNYLLAVRSEGAGGGPLTRAAFARLQLFDVPADFLAEVVRTGEARRTFVFRSPADGVVIEKMAVAGQMIKPGERIYRLADLSTVWALTQVYESDLPFVRAGQAAAVHVTYGPDRTLNGQVALVLPQVEEQTRAATARIVLPNSDGLLRPGMFVDVRFSAQLAESAVLVPETAILRSGERNTVFIALPDGSFEPREVQPGARSEGGRYEVRNGLAAGERIVTSGQFMLDSESQLREAIQKMLKSTPAASEGKPPAAAAAERRPAPDARKVKYYQSTMISGETNSKPGKDSMGMDLVPVYDDGNPAAQAETGATQDENPTTDLAFALADAAAALATDDLSGYHKQLPAVRAALAAYLRTDAQAVHGPLGKYSGAPADAIDLQTARRDFAPLSTAVADLTRAGHLHHTAGLHIFECPMAPVVVKGRWLQRTAELRNPFYGSAMPTCGEEIN
ncbi:MAG: efflux RND transporter periplasmic adaptor subunit [Opitutaceae bacterium]|nr:efflux RND transporter periplasmic adaptor subunit [Opitutaceae bacterium]